MNLKNKKVLITGSAIRIGRALCQAFASHGAQIILHYNNSVKEAETLFAELGGTKKGHTLTQGDLTHHVYTNNLVSSCGQVDILINNASIFDSKSLAEENLAASHYQYEINFWAPMILMQQFQKQHLPEGLIINILDQRIYSLDDSTGSYLLSKKTLADATKLAALQWAPTIRVNGIAPGAVMPPLSLPNSKMEKSIAATPLKRPTPIDEITNTAIFLAKNNSITGEIITLDGGKHLTHIVGLT